MTLVDLSSPLERARLRAKQYPEIWSMPELRRAVIINGGSNDEVAYALMALQYEVLKKDPGFPNFKSQRFGEVNLAKAFKYRVTLSAEGSGTITKDELRQLLGDIRLLMDILKRHCRTWQEFARTIDPDSAAS